jgi:hypothetical protein
MHVINELGSEVTYCSFLNTCSVSQICLFCYQITGVFTLENRSILRRTGVMTLAHRTAADRREYNLSFATNSVNL